MRGGHFTRLGRTIERTGELVQDDPRPCRPAMENPMPRKSSPSASSVAPVTGPELGSAIYLDLLRKMVTVDYIEERLKVFVRAGKVSFHASTRGHEKLQIAMSMLLESGKDWFFPYYREKALMVGLGMSSRDIFLHMLSKADDPCGGGRNMSE